MRATFLACLFIAAVSCRSTVDQPIRSGKGSDFVVKTSAVELAIPSNRARAALASVEHHPDFTLGIVEFGDEGLLWDTDQRTGVFRTLEQAVKIQNAGAITITFVHGWRHNGALCDDNVACFRSVLHSIAASENAAAQEANRSPRAVVGFYLAWRGLAECQRPAVWTSIWSRKRADERMGSMQARTTIAQILRFHAKIREAFPDSHSRLVVAGHSLGAGVLYSAVAPLVRQSFHDALLRATKGPKPVSGDKPIMLDVIGDFGTDSDGTTLPIPDLIVLVNPAFEAELYKNTPRDLTYMANHNIHFSREQWPVMLIVSSPADWATRWVFPLGQALYLLTTPSTLAHGPFATGRTLITAAKYPTFVTDIAITIGKGSSRQHESKTGSSCYQGDAVKLAEEAGGGCDCTELLPESIAAAQAETEDKEPAKGRRVGLAKLVHIRQDVDESNPFLVVRADSRMLSSHDDIYNATFLSFLQALLRDVDAEKRTAGR